ncbi:hypothetical protein RCL1_005508 [Eukaryota sp. TZLM3-RCL]
MFSFVSSDSCREYPILLKLSDFEWSRPRGLSSQNVVIQLQAEIFSTSLPQLPIPIHFSSILLPAESVHLSITEYISFPFSIADLSHDSYILFSISSSTASSFSLVGTCKLFFFDDLGRYSSGWHTLRFYNQEVHHPADSLNSSLLRGKILSQISNQSKSDWLDNLSSRALYQLFSSLDEYLVPIITLHIAALDLPIFHYKLLGIDEKKEEDVTLQNPSATTTGSENFTPLFDSFEQNPLNDLLALVFDNSFEGSTTSLTIPLLESILSNFKTNNSKSLSQSDKQIIWRARNSDFLRSIEGGLLLLLESVDWGNSLQSSEALLCVEEEFNWNLPRQLSDLLGYIKIFFRVPVLLDFGGLFDRLLNQCETSNFDLIIFPLLQSFRYFNLPQNNPNLYKFFVSFLVKNALLNDSLLTELYWLIKAEQEFDGSVAFKNFLKYLSELLTESMSFEQVQIFTKQSKFLHEVSKLSNLISNPKFEKNATNMMTFTMTAHARLSSLVKTRQRSSSISGSSPFNPLFSGNNISQTPLLIPTHLFPISDVSEKIKIYSSNFYPVKYTFLDSFNNECAFIFKKGDDLRQDFFILKLIHLVDRLLKASGIDAKLTLYKAIPLSSDHGLIEFVPNCSSMADFSKEDLFVFLRSPNTIPSTTTRLHNFTISCAAYTIISFCFGIRDRHEHNLLINTTDGRFFHIDFGYILDSDPKPFQTPIRFDDKYIHAMGEEYFNKFREYCCVIFSVMRRSASLFIDMFSLIGESKMISVERMGKNTVNKISEKFRLDLTEEEAQGVILDEIEIARRALAPKVAELIHGWNQTRRMKGLEGMD